MPSGEKSIPGGNAGWGGPPKGAGRGGPARNPKNPFKKSGAPNDGVPTVPSFADAPKAGPGSGHVSIAGEDRRARREMRAEKMEDRLYELGEGADRQETQLSAAVAYLNQVRGMPLARSVNVNSNDFSQLSDAELDAEITRLARKLGADSAGENAAGVPEEPDGVVR